MDNNTRIKVRFLYFYFKCAGNSDCLLFHCKFLFHSYIPTHTYQRHVSYRSLIIIIKIILLLFFIFQYIPTCEYCLLWFHYTLSVVLAKKMIIELLKRCHFQFDIECIKICVRKNLLFASFATRQLYLIP